MCFFSGGSNTISPFSSRCCFKSSCKTTPGVGPELMPWNKRRGEAEFPRAREESLQWYLFFFEFFFKSSGCGELSGGSGHSAASPPCTLWVSHSSSCPLSSFKQAGRQFKRRHHLGASPALVFRSLEFTLVLFLFCFLFPLDYWLLSFSF